MKNVLMILVIVCGSFAGCRNDESDQEQDNFPARAVETAFWTKYPNASNVKWEREGVFQKADFQSNQEDYEAWFNVKGVWLQAEYNSSYTNLPAAVKDLLANSIDYPPYTWIPDKSVDVLERKDYLAWYGIDLKNAPKEITVWAEADGNRSYDVTEDFDGGDIPTAISSYLTKKYAQGLVTDVHKLANLSYIANMLDGEVVKSVYFDRDMGWKYTEWPVLLSDVPQAVKSVFDAPAYEGFGVQRVSFQQYPAGEWYHFVIKQTGVESMTETVNIDPEGNIVL